MSNFPSPITSSGAAARTQAMSIHETPEEAKTSTGLSVDQFNSLPAKERKKIIDKFMETNTGRELMGAAAKPALSGEGGAPAAGAAGGNPLQQLAGAAINVVTSGISSVLGRGA